MKKSEGEAAEWDWETASAAQSTQRQKASSRSRDRRVPRVRTSVWHLRDTLFYRRAVFACVFMHSIVCTRLTALQQRKEEECGAAESSAQSVWLRDCGNPTRPCFALHLLSLALLLHLALTLLRRCVFGHLCESLRRGNPDWRSDSHTRTTPRTFLSYRAAGLAVQRGQVDGVGAMGERSQRASLYCAWSRLESSTVNESFPLFPARCDVLPSTG